MLVSLKRISIALGLLAAAGTLSASTRALAGVPTSGNQATADAVASALKSSSALAKYRIEILAQNGQVTLSGTVATPAQKYEAIARTQRVAGVASVTDQLRVLGLGSDSGIRPAQYQFAMNDGAQPPQMAFGGNVPPVGGMPMNGGMMGGPMMGGPIGGEMIANAGMMNGGMMGGGMMNGGMMGGEVIGGDGILGGGPTPEGLAGMPGATQAAVPNAPNYAWPSYAPYPNFSAVGYPTTYPWQAWPNIGPFYPYPEVPLDWRAVTLRWDDGIWWLDFRKHYTRPFFTPYPFGLFAY